MRGGAVRHWGEVGSGGYELVCFQRLFWIDQFLRGLAVFGGAVAGLSDGCSANRSEPVGASDGQDGGGGDVYAGGAGGLRRD